MQIEVVCAHPQAPSCDPVNKEIVRESPGYPEGPARGSTDIEMRGSIPEEIKCDARRIIIQVEDPSSGGTFEVLIFDQRVGYD
jgi:hypothetical protein